MNNEITHNDFLSNKLKEEIEEKYKKLMYNDSIQGNNFNDLLKRAIDDAYDKGWEIAITTIKSYVNKLS